MSRRAVGVRLATPNPRFERWLERRVEETRGHDARYSSQCSRALVALRKYPLALRSGGECALLDGFTRRLCEEIDAEFAPEEPTTALADFAVVLLVDSSETAGANKKCDPVIQEFDKYEMIDYEVRRLKVGDFVWIARDTVTKKELVLPYIVERKRIDDLGKSIKDGRFHEQKFRLKKCGIPNIIYLIEKNDSIKHIGLPLSTLSQAAINTRIRDKFNIHFTSSLSDSVKFLAIMTKHLSDHYKTKMLKECPMEMLNNAISCDRYIPLMSFDEFCSISSKSNTLTVSDMFIKQLLQIKGVSVEKAITIVSLYKTPSNLLKHYRNMSSSEAERMLCNLNSSDNKSSLGFNISKLIYSYFTTEKLY